MKFSSLLTPIVLILLPSSALSATTVTLAYDTTYDAASGSLSTVACSDGTNGLLTRGYTTFGSLPSFPNIGAAVAVEGWNSANCGTCWSLTYTNSTGGKKSINVLAIDHAGAGFNVALAAMNELTNGQGVALGRVNVASTQVASSVCGL